MLIGERSEVLVKKIFFLLYKRNRVFGDFRRFSVYCSLLFIPTIDIVGLIGMN